MSATYSYSFRAGGWLFFKGSLPPDLMMFSHCPEEERNVSRMVQCAGSILSAPLQQTFCSKTVCPRCGDGASVHCRRDVLQITTRIALSKGNSYGA